MARKMAPPPSRGRVNQKDVQGPPGKLKARDTAFRKVDTKKPTKAPPARGRADAGSASENNRLARQVADRVRQRIGSFAED